MLKNKFKERIIDGHTILLDKFIAVPTHDIQSPKEGRVCMAKRYWVTTKCKEVLFFKTYNNPQCNTSLGIANYLLDNAMYPKDIHIQYIEMAYVPYSYTEI